LAQRARWRRAGLGHDQPARGVRRNSDGPFLRSRPRLRSRGEWRGQDARIRARLETRLAARGLSAFLGVAAESRTDQEQSQPTACSVWPAGVWLCHQLEKSAITATLGSSAGAPGKCWVSSRNTSASGKSAWKMLQCAGSLSKAAIGWPLRRSSGAKRRLNSRSLISASGIEFILKPDAEMSDLEFK